ncbi:2-C-methyl-D-erythritol 4-phosphate cytidylyltransferase [Bacillus sp. FJAT-45350]|uniref:2-C-methyl-D-erythritol 4-phosphate cytidylyltransferase n=1 Tax=Bacillus sp. FJAT-45350 TaxID=2011014 RepID=UPI000BB8992F|nr:2-C-methyl-D-erythritol 4-phosphate cytidylyltransferase [Bacillus sp. FJAT-45350]
MLYSVVIPAAGQGKRMKAGKNKQFISLAGKPVIIHTLLVFEEDPLCSKVVLVANSDEVEVMKELVEKHCLTKIDSIVSGGSERQFSVSKGLSALTDEDEIVLIHDGARPFIRKEHIHELVQVTSKDGAAIIAVPVKDTVKLGKDKQVVNTVDRSSLWAVQTPQAFQLSLVKQAHKEAMEENYLGTDDASLVERMGKKVSIVQGDYLNMKLTTPEDLLFAEAILQSKWGET